MVTRKGEYPLKESSTDQMFTALNYIVLSLFFITIAYPIIYILSASFSSTDAVTTGRVWLWPVEFSLEGYKAVFKYNQIWIGFRNSLFYMVVGTLINIILTIIAAYPLSRKGFLGKKYFMFLFVFTIMFSGGVIPTYLLVKDIGLLNSVWAMLLPSAMSVFNVIITRTYFQNNIPQEMLEAAQMDGCNDFLFLSKIVIPLSGPILAVITLFYAVGHWNSYFNALLYLRNQSLYPLQLVLRTILIQNQVDPNMLSNVDDMNARQGLADLLKYSLIVVATVPLIVVYPFVQKHFVKGVMVGSLKG
jgi:putative aldouronate transport system permease protein